MNMRKFLNSRRRWLTPWMLFGLVQGTVNLVVSAAFSLPVPVTIACALLLGYGIALIVCSWEHYRDRVRQARLRRRWHSKLRFARKAATAVLESTFKRFNAEQDEVVLMVFGREDAAARREGMN
jgi:hypothetical protein